MLIKIKNMKKLLLLITGVSPQGYPLLDTQGESPQDSTNKEESLLCGRSV